MIIFNKGDSVRSKKTLGPLSMGDDWIVREVRYNGAGRTFPFVFVEGIEVGFYGSELIKEEEL